MKRMKLLVMIMAAAMLLSACNAVNVTEVVSVGDAFMEKPEFMYYLQSGKSQAMQEAQAKGMAISTDKDWKTVMIGDKTAAEFAKEKALEAAKTVMVLEAKGKAEGYVMTDADQEQVKTQKDQIIQQLGGRYGYEQALDEMGITMEALDTIVERSVYANAYMVQYSGENPTAFEPTEEEIKARYNEEYVFVRHILISNEAPEDAGEEVAADAEPVDYDAKAKEEAEDILEKLNQGGDFIALMNEFSDDTRDDAGKLVSDGYVMTDNGQMVPSFEEAAMKLEIGKYTTELVPSSYGYHILMRYELPTSGDDYDVAIPAVTSALTSEKLQNQVNAWGEELGFACNDKYYKTLKIKMEG